VLAGWEVAVRAAAVPTYVLPAPGAIAVKLWTDSAGLSAALATTLGEAVAGYVIGNAIGFVLAVAFFYRPVLDRLVMPLIVALNSVPAVAFAPVVILWFGVGMTSKIVLVAFITGFIALQNQLQGFRQSDLQAVNVLRSFGAGEWRIAGVAFFVLVSAVERQAVWWHVSIGGAQRRSRRAARRITS
jgi:NitT/TauT family transport system permease protein